MSAYQDLLQICPNTTLVAVSKQQNEEKILDLYRQGQRDFAENYVQELLSKAPSLPADIRWHFIGHLQTNKVKQILPVVSWIQSVDSLKLYAKIRQNITLRNKPIKILLQVHIAQEEHKFGFLPEALLSDFSALEPHPLIEICGLMGMASFTDDQAQILAEFQTLHQLFRDLQAKYQATYPYFQTCSMGMSADYQLALQAGSNMLRIGSLLFGSRV